MKPIISVEGLGKKYTIRHEGQGRYRALREEIFKLPQRLFQHGHQDKEEFWALRDVSFDIMPGDRVGIIGRNGAGKSTLLKLLSRITEPSTGKITLRGRVASLLEVGTGFHPELTGRENIFLNGAILGMSRAEVRRKFDEIVDFAGVEKFLDTPVKRYSSGMYVRLAFAVAAHLEPEILTVDEVLAVGDAEFQKKCLGKMKQVGQEGRTVLFVSHNMAAIKQLCHNAILFNNGEVISSASAELVIQEYLSYQYNLKKYFKEIDQYIILRDVLFKTKGDQNIDSFKVDDLISISIIIEIKSPCIRAFNCGFTDSTGRVHFMSLSGKLDFRHEKQYPIIKCVQFTTYKGLFNDGIYFMSIVFLDEYFNYITGVDLIKKITIEDCSFARKGYIGNFSGNSRPNLTWRIKNV